MAEGSDYALFHPPLQARPHPHLLPPRPFLPNSRQSSPAASQVTKSVKFRFSPKDGDGMGGEA